MAITSTNVSPGDTVLASQQNSIVTDLTNLDTDKAPKDSPTFTTAVTVPETAGASDYDKFMVLDSGVIKYRTGDQLKSDIGVTDPVRLYDIVVDASGGGDYTTLSNAITAASEGDTIFIKNGTYSSVGTLTWKDGVSLIGESKDGVIIEDAGFTIQGTGVTSTGTVSLTRGSATLSGTGTQFSTDSVSAGDKVFIGSLGIILEVLSVTNNTTLTLNDSFRGQSQSGLNFKIITTKQNCDFKNLSFEGSSAGFVYALNRCNNINIENCNFVSVDGDIVLISDDICNITVKNCVSIDNSYFARSIAFANKSFNINIINNYIINNKEIGISMVNISFLNISENFIQSCGEGIRIPSASHINIIDNIITNSYGVGINTTITGELHKSTIKGNKVYDNGSYGIYIATNSDNNIITNNSVNRNGDRGIYIKAGTCNKNIVSNNIALNNTTANFTDNGTGTVTDGSNITA